MESPRTLLTTADWKQDRMDQEARFSSWSLLEHEANLKMTDKCQTNVESGVKNRIYSQEGNC